MLLDQMDGSGVGECMVRVLVGFSGQPTTQRFLNQGCSIICTETPVLKDNICCWIYTMNPSERHLPMAMRVQSGTFTICMAMALPERRECVSTSSGENMSLATPTRQVSALRTDMMFETLTEKIP